jgi:hypothetical protein
VRIRTRRRSRSLFGGLLRVNLRGLEPTSVTTPLGPLSLEWWRRPARTARHRKGA